MSTSSVPGGSSVTSGGGGNGGGCSSGGGGGGGGGGGPCGACKFLRRKCVAGCIFAPYFDSEQGAAHFAAVHKVFGASNVSKLLLHIPVHKRLDAVVTICYEAQARLRDPVYGCVAHIFSLQQQVMNLQAEISYLQTHLAALEIPTQHPVPPPSMFSAAASANLSDLSTCDLSAIFDPLTNPSNNFYARQQMDTRQFSNASFRTMQEPPLAAGVGGGGPGGGGGDLQELARELLNRHAPAVVPCRNHDAAMPTAPR